MPERPASFARLPPQVTFPKATHSKFDKVLGSGPPRRQYLVFSDGAQYPAAAEVSPLPEVRKWCARPTCRSGARTRRRNPGLAVASFLVSVSLHKEVTLVGLVYRSGRRSIRLLSTNNRLAPFLEAGAHLRSAGMLRAASRPEPDGAQLLKGRLHLNQLLASLSKAEGCTYGNGVRDHPRQRAAGLSAYLGQNLS